MFLVKCINREESLQKAAGDGSGGPSCRKFHFTGISVLFSFPRQDPLPAHVSYLCLIVARRVLHTPCQSTLRSSVRAFKSFRVLPPNDSVVLHAGLRSHLALRLAVALMIHLAFDFIFYASLSGSIKPTYVLLHQTGGLLRAGFLSWGGLDPWNPFLNSNVRF